MSRSNKNKKTKSVNKRTDKRTDAPKVSNPVSATDIEPECEGGRRWKILFWAFAAAILLCMLIVAPRTGISGDEWIDGLNGRYSLEYYTSGDTTFADYSKVPEMQSYPHMKYYGNGYEIIPAIALKYLHLSPSREFVFRHILCALFGFLLILFTGLIGRLLKDWKLGLISLLMIALTPVVFGLSFLDTKDIPMAAGFAMATYGFLALFKSLPNFKIKDIVLATAGIAMAVSIRIGGLMLPLYLVVGYALLILFDKEKRQLLFSRPFNVLWRTLGIGALIVIVGSLAGLCLYPNFFHEGPVAHIKGAMALVSNFPQYIPMIFEGKTIDSLHLPDYYLLKSFLITVPLFVFAAAVLFLVNIVRIFKKNGAVDVLFLLFTVIFPLIFIVAKGANIYNGWRHETFVYPGFVVLASLGFYETTLWFRSHKFGKTWRWVCLAVAVACVIPTIVWMARNDRYIYSYYNALVPDPYLKYDLDYYGASASLAYEWFRENELPKCNGKVTVSTKIHSPIFYAAALGDTNRVNLIHADYMAYARTECDYSILNYQCIKAKAIENFFPPKGTIHVEYVDGDPVCAVVKRNKLDARGIKLCSELKYPEGLVLLDSAYSYDTNNFGLWFWIGLANFQLHNNEPGLKFLKKDLDFITNEDILTVDNSQAFSIDNAYIGIMLYEKGEYDEALGHLQNAVKLCRNAQIVSISKGYIGLCYYSKLMFREALPYLQEGLPAFPELRDKYEYCLAMCQ